MKEVKMKIKTFDTSFLREVKCVLKEVFFNEHSNELFNEWEFAERILKSKGYLPELCLVALVLDLKRERHFIL